MKDFNPRFLVDAGPIVGLLDADDQWHSWSVRTLTVIVGALVTTETAVAEACYHLRRHRPALLAIIAMIEQGALILEAFPAPRVFRIAELLKAYPKMDFGDATLVILSERYPKATLITTDRKDFTVYRRQDGGSVPFVAPAAR